MNKLIVLIIFAYVFTVNISAEPIGYILCSITVSTGYEIVALNVETGEKQVLHSQYLSSMSKIINAGPMPYYGIGAPPFLGDPCVIQNDGELSISLIYFDGTVHDVIPTDYLTNNFYPCFSFDGEKIAYVEQDVSPSNDDILAIINFDGSGKEEIYHTPLWSVDIEQPTFSPDRTTLAFVMEDDHHGSHAVYTLPVSGGVPQELTDLPLNAGHPAFSPDGTKLACISTAGGGIFHLFIANADGSNPQQITSGSDFALYPSFSPDSKYIACASNDGIKIIDLSNNQIVKEIPLDYLSYHGLVWCLGARKSEGTIAKAKIKNKSVSIKIENMKLDTVPNYGLVQIDKTTFELSNTNLWTNKKDKKYIYKDKTEKITAKATVKNEKVKFSAKKLSLKEGIDYALNTNVPVAVNFGDQTIVETIQFDAKGKFKGVK